MLRGKSVQDSPHACCRFFRKKSIPHNRVYALRRSFPPIFLDEFPEFHQHRPDFLLLPPFCCWRNHGGKVNYFTHTILARSTHRMRSPWVFRRRREVTSFCAASDADLTVYYWRSERNKISIRSAWIWEKKHSGVAWDWALTLRRKRFHEGK